MTSREMASSRPNAITVGCILGLIVVALGIPALFGVASHASLPVWYIPYIGLTMLVGLVGLMGMWQMKRWGALLYAGMFLANQIILFATGLWTPGTVIIPLIVALIALSHLSKMD